MQPGTPGAPASGKSVWAGRILSALAVMFLLFDGILHAMNPAPVVAAFAQLGYPNNLALGIGIVELACVGVYVLPRTSVLGAVLLTGYLGGATATQVRVGHPLFAETLFPVYVGVLVWGGLLLRDGRLRALFPVRR
jgi:DoxX-like protein